ncbi:MAG: YgaP-like transmembrane domain [Vicinamibacterales bacterium]
MITIYGADWCEDTRRSLRHLRRLAIAHHYVNVDEDAEALATAKALNGGARRTPTIDLGIGGSALVEPDNDTLSAALVELQMLTDEDVHERLGLQNVGDVERMMRVGAGAALMLVAGSTPRPLRWPLRIAGMLAALTGFAGWCPAYHASGMSSLEGPGDRPEETTREAWLVRRTLTPPGIAATEQMQ